MFWLVVTIPIVVLSGGFIFLGYMSARIEKARQEQNANTQ
jgi:hypothetical protein